MEDSRNEMEDSRNEMEDHNPYKVYYQFDVEDSETYEVIETCDVDTDYNKLDDAYNMVSERHNPDTTNVVYKGVHIIDLRYPTASELMELFFDTGSVLVVREV